MSRLVSIDTGALLDGVLPTPKIREVKISYSSFPPPVSNPHIDHARETIIYTDRTGQQALKHPGFTIKKDPRNLLLEISVVLTDNISSSGQSKWVLEQDLLQYMHLQIIHCEDPAFSEAIKTRKVDPVPAEVARMMENNNKVKTDIRPLSGISALEGFYGDQMPEPGAKELVLKFNFAIATTNPEHLTYFANVFLDVDQLVNDYSLNLSNEMRLSSCGDTTVEAVYRDGKRVDTARVYYTKNTQAAYTGKVYRVAPTTYVPSDKLNDEVIRKDILRIVTTNNTSSGTTADKYIRQLLKIAQNDSATETKLLQIKKLLSGWTARNPKTIAGSIHLRVQDMHKGYRSIIEDSIKLTSKIVPNPTINDVRSIDEMSVILPPEPPEQEVEQVIADIRSRDANTSAQMLAQNLENAQYFSNCMITRDSNSATRLAFLMDWERLAINSSSHKSLIMKADAQIKQMLFSKLQLQHIRLIRERVDENNTLSQFDNHMTRDREALVEVISDAFRSSGTGFLKGERHSANRTSSEKRLIGTLKETKIKNVTSSKIKAFEAYDNAIQKRNAGKFKYRIEVSFIDKIGDLLYQKVAELRLAKEELKKYYNICTLPCNYDTLGERFTEFFTSALYKSYGLPTPEAVSGMSQEDMNILLAGNSPLGAPWLRPVTKYVELLKIINATSDADADALAKKIYMQLEPSTASPDSVLGIINKFEALESNILETILVNQLGNEVSKYSFSNSKIARKLTKAHRITYQFGEVYDNKTLSNVGAKYLYYGKESTEGLAKISKPDFMKRIVEEQKRFFTNTPQASSKASEDMSTYRYSYLAPAHMQVGSKKLYLLNRGEALYTTEQYKEMMYSISLLQSAPAARSMTMPVTNWPLGATSQTSNTDVSTSKLNFGAISLLSRFGITFSPATPYMRSRYVKSKPLAEVASILGENTLLAMHNAIKVDEGEGESNEIVTDIANSEVSIADITSFASSLIGTLAGTGLQGFLGTQSPHMQIADLSEDQVEKMRLSKTLEFFDLSSPYNGVDKSLATATTPTYASTVRQIPNQLKSLLLTKTGKVTPRKNWHQSEIDPIASPETRPLFEILYFNLQKIEALTGFNASPSNNKLLRSPRFELLKPEHLEGKGKLICRMARYRNSELHIGDSRMMDIPVYNRYFIIDLDAERITSPNPPAKTNMYTSGGEYQTTTGTNYIGYYHIHKDGTVMTGPDMGLAESILLPNSDTTTESNSAASTLVDNLATTVSNLGGLERVLITSLVSQGYVMKGVKSDFCVTEDTIKSSDLIASTLKSGDAF